MKEVYVMEARKPDGSLDVKRIGTEPIQQGDIDKYWDYYFSKHPMAKSANMSDMITFFSSKGWTLRKKTW